MTTETDLPEAKLREIANVVERFQFNARRSPAETAKVIREAADALASIRAERDAAVAATIEECARVAEKRNGISIAAAIRAIAGEQK